MDSHTANWDHCLEHAALSDVGLRRANNQDAMAVVVADSQEAWQRRGHLFIVADGMGAHAAGELASKIVTDTVPLTYHKLLDKSPPEAILAAVQDANDQIHSRGQASPDFKGMGTTSTALLLLPQGAMLAHVGDSRAYRLRENHFQQLTFDHSLVWELRAGGQLSEDQVPDYVPKNIITRSLGPNPTVRVDLEGPFSVGAGDTFLLCSDGLSGPVTDEEMGTILGCLPPAEAARALVDLANLRGGPDNITVIVVRVTGPQVIRSAGPESARATAPVAVGTVHPLIWTLLGTSSLAGVGLLSVEYLIAALVCLIVATGAAIAALMQRQNTTAGGFRFDGRRLGRGPYSNCKCQPHQEFVQQLGGIVEKLCDAAKAEDWAVDWTRLNSLLEQASAASKSADHTEAVRQYARAITFMMAQLKRQRDSDSNVLGQ